MFIVVIFELNRLHKHVHLIQKVTQQYIQPTTWLILHSFSCSLLFVSHTHIHTHTLYMSKQNTHKHTQRFLTELIRLNFLSSLLLSTQQSHKM